MGITLDIGHMCFNGGEGCREYGSIGSGGIDFEGVVGALKEIRYAGSLCLELNPERVTLEQVIDSKNRLEKIIGE